MNSFFIILVARLGYFLGVANVYDSKWNVVRGHLEYRLEVILYPSLRICTAPNCAKTEVGGTKEHILYRRGAILNPKFGRRCRESARGVAGNYNNERGIKAGEE